MARSRNIKPGFFTNDLLAQIEPLGRLLFSGLWTIADREGRLRDRPRKIWAELLPYDDDADVDFLLNELAIRGFIIRYEVDNQKLVQIVNWNKHQQPHYKEAPSELPPPPGHEDSGVVAFAVPESQRRRIMERDGHTCQQCGKKKNLSIDHIIPRSRGGSGDDDNLQVLCLSCNASKNNRIAAEANRTSGQSRPDVESTSPNGHPLIPDSLNLIPDSLNLIPSISRKRESKRATPFPSDFVVTDADYGWAAEKTGFGRQRVDRERQKFEAHALANGRRLKDWRQGFRNWLLQAVDFQGNRPIRPTKEQGPPPEHPDWLWDEQAGRYRDPRFVV